MTQGEYEVMDVWGFNKKDKTVVYSSNERHPLQKNTFSVDMKGRRTLLDGGEGWHSFKLSKGGIVGLDTWSSPDVCKKMDLITIGKKPLTRNLLTAAEPWDAYKVPEMKVGTIKAADGTTDLYYRLVLPTDFDPTKKYPAVVYVYGGPHAHIVDASRHWECVDGTSGWRRRAT